MDASKEQLDEVIRAFRMQHDNRSIQMERADVKSDPVVIDSLKRLTETVERLGARAESLRAKLSLVMRVVKNDAPEPENPPRSDVPLDNAIRDINDLALAVERIIVDTLSRLEI